VGAFILVLAALIIFLKLLGRFGRGRGFKGGQTFILRGTMSLDSRRYLAAVEVDGQLIIVGVTPDRLTSLGQWPLAEDEPFRDLPPEPLRSKDPFKPHKTSPKSAKTDKVKEKPQQQDSSEPFTWDPPKVKVPLKPVPVKAVPSEPAPVKPAPSDPQPIQPLLGTPVIVPPVAAPKAVSEHYKPESVGPTETIELEPLTVFEPSQAEPRRVDAVDLLDFTLTLDDEPFTGPEVNDEFLDLDIIDEPPEDRR
jgi:flagellar biogenesis protein FliO